MDGNRAKQKKQLGAVSVVLELPVNQKSTIGHKQSLLPRDFSRCQTDGYIHISPLPKGEAETVKFGTSTKGGNVSILTENTVSHVLYRSQEEKFQDPSRLSLDRRNFVTIPIFEGEEQLKLLNLQHNCITQIQNLNPLVRLVFLDLYDNRIEEIYGLENLHSLRVLMLGRNRIRHITGLESLTKLDVLDLHGNLISYIDNIGHLCHLRVLNLAGNDIAIVEDLSTMYSLTELNLRRNRITHFDCGHLPFLKRLFLSHNLLESLDDISSTVLSLSLNELSIDGNPFANKIDHRRLIISYMTNLVTLNQHPVSETERIEAVQTATQEELQINELHKQLKIMKQRESLIATIKEEWEAQRANPVLLPGKTSYVENEENVLILYGGLALEVLKDSSTPMTEHLILHYMNFRNELNSFCLIRGNLSTLHTLDCHKITLTTLSDLKLLSKCVPSSLVILNIIPDGNPVTNHPLYCDCITCLLPNVEVNGQKTNHYFHIYQQLHFSPRVIEIKDPVVKQKASMLGKSVQYKVHVHHNKKTLYNQLWPLIKDQLLAEACRN